MKRMMLILLCYLLMGCSNEEKNDYEINTAQKIAPTEEQTQLDMKKYRDLLYSFTYADFDLKYSEPFIAQTLKSITEKENSSEYLVEAKRIQSEIHKIFQSIYDFQITKEKGLQNHHDDLVASLQILEMDMEELYNIAEDNGSLSIWSDALEEVRFTRNEVREPCMSLLNLTYEMVPHSNNSSQQSTVEHNQLSEFEASTLVDEVVSTKFKNYELFYSDNVERDGSEFFVIDVLEPQPEGWNILKETYYVDKKSGQVFKFDATQNTLTQVTLNTKTSNNNQSSESGNVPKKANSPISLSPRTYGTVYVKAPEGWIESSIEGGDFEGKKLINPEDGNQEMSIIISGCAGCPYPYADTSLPPEPLSLIPENAMNSQIHSSGLSASYTYHTSGNPYSRDGVVIIQPGSGYAIVEIQLPENEKSVATSILNSFDFNGYK